MNFTLLDLLKVIGSLGLFLYGMKVMSEGIQKFAGQRLRSVLEAITRKRAMGVIFGLLITSLIQSSSATTVMVVGFANVGLLSLLESFGVIMGANIGTTITAWLVSIFGFKVHIEIILVPLIGLGFFMMMFSREQLRSLGQFIIGFALLFLGLEYLKSSVPDLQNFPEIFHYFESLSSKGFGNILLFVGIGTVVTIILQSSSATIALTFVLCINGWINFESAAAIVLGENLGTTLTANIAALIGNIHAKRAAFSHTLFNLFGILWAIIIFQPFLSFIDFILTEFANLSPFADKEAVPIGLALFHSSFNIVNTLILLTFSKYFTDLIKRIIISRENNQDRYQLEYIGSGFINITELSVLEARKGLHKYGDMICKMFNFIPGLLVKTDEVKFEQLLQRIKKYETISDQVEIEITQFLVKVSNTNISHSGALKVRKMRQISSNFERIGDTVYKISQLIQKKDEEKAYFTQDQRNAISAMIKLNNELFDIAMEGIENKKNKVDLQRIEEIENEISKCRDSITEELFSKINTEGYNIKSAFYFNKLTGAYEKIADLLTNINESLVEINQ